MTQPANQRLSLTKAQPHVLQQYGEQTRSAVTALAEALQPKFEAEQRGALGRAWARQLEPLFALWCEQSGVVTPETTVVRLASSGASSAQEIARVLKNDLGFPTDPSVEA